MVTTSSEIPEHLSCVLIYPLTFSSQGPLILADFLERGSTELSRGPLRNENPELMFINCQDDEKTEHSCLQVSWNIILTGQRCVMFVYGAEHYFV